MPGKTAVNGVPIADIVKHYEEIPELVQRVSHRKVPAPELAIEEPNPKWPEFFQMFKQRILNAFEQKDGYSQLEGEGSEIAVTVLAINHVGSTSVPKLPAKAIIDIDLVLSSVLLPHESYYVPRLEAAGFQFLLREPAWHEHRFFVASEPIACNLHVFGPRCPEVERHRIFKEWLTEHEDDRKLYAETKKQCAALANEKGETTQDYTLRKDDIIQQIRMRAFKSLGYVV